MSSFDTAAHFSVRGRRILVTGASSGLGQHFARTLAAAGAEVFAGARSLDRLQALVGEISRDGGLASAVALDVVQRDSIRAALDQIGDLDVLVNNAGVSDTKALLDYTSEQWDSIIQTNLTGSWAMAQETAKRMILAKRQGCSIINITSILGSRVAGGVSPYIASKAGLKALTQAMALELARYGIRVNSIAPGYITTNLNEEFLNSEAGQRLRQRIPARRFGAYDDLNGALLLLAPPVPLILVGLTLCAVCGMLCQAVSTGYVTLTAKEGRSSAVGLYASVFYIGGSAGAFLTGLAWASAGWTGCVVLIVAMQLVMAVIVAAAWD